MGVTENEQATMPGQLGQVIPPVQTVESQTKEQVSPTGPTQRDLDIAVHKAVSDQGRKFAEERRTWQKQKDDTELEAVRADPEKFNALKNNQEASRSRAEAKELLAQAQEIKAQADATTATSRAEALSKEYAIDASALISISGGDPSKMEQMAKYLPKVNPTIEDAGTKTLRLDSNQADGGGAKALPSLLKEDTRGYSPSQLAEYKLKIESAARGLPIK